MSLDFQEILTSFFMQDIIIKKKQLVEMSFLDDLFDIETIYRIKIYCYLCTHYISFHPALEDIDPWN